MNRIVRLSILCNLQKAIGEIFWGKPTCFSPRTNTIDDGSNWTTFSYHFSHNSSLWNVVILVTAQWCKAFNAGPWCTIVFLLVSKWLPILVLSASHNSIDKNFWDVFVTERLFSAVKMINKLFLVAWNIFSWIGNALLVNNQT